MFSLKDSIVWNSSCCPVYRLYTYSIKNVVIFLSALYLKYVYDDTSCLKIVAGGKPKALSDIDWHVNSRKESRDVDQPTESGRIVLQDEEILTDLDHSVPNESSISSIRQTFKGQWSSDLLSVSPTHSPRFWRRDTDNQVLQAESLVSEAAEARDTVPMVTHTSFYVLHVFALFSYVFKQLSLMILVKSLKIEMGYIQRM